MGALPAGSGERGERGARLLLKPIANDEGGGAGNPEATKVDFFALLYIVKKERIMYIEILF